MTGPDTMIPLSERVAVAVAAALYLGEGKRRKKQELRVVRGGAGGRRGADWPAVSWGACLPAGKGHRRERE